MVAALGLAGACAGIFSTTASAAPAGGSVDLCVDSGADYSAALSFPKGNVTAPATHGGCIPWQSASAGETVTVLAYYGGSIINLGHFGTDGSIQIAYAHGDVKSGTEHATVTNY
jgi:hypothetical protein